MGEPDIPKWVVPDKNAVRFLFPTPLWTLFAVFDPAGKVLKILPTYEFGRSTICFIKYSSPNPSSFFGKYQCYDVAIWGMPFPTAVLILDPAPLRAVEALI